MKIKNIKKILAWGCFLIFFVLGYYFYKIEWDILSIIFFVSGIISLLLAYYDNNQEPQNKKELKCPKCKGLFVLGEEYSTITVSLEFFTA